ncbi:hypothetical protein RZS08_00760, partial [Arthrospira platensis SPKY1]|nr:hypothetical protein [Arthrospira platensis SPKY1]
MRVRDVSAYFCAIGTREETTRSAGSVRGNLTVSRDHEGVLTVSTGALRCSCAEYQMNSDCIHLRIVADITRNRLDPPARTRARLTDAEREEAVRQAQQRAEEA